MLDFLNSVEYLFADKTAKNISYYNTEKKMNFSAYNIALLGINSEENSDNTNKIREEFYKLYIPENIDLLDLGNIIEKDDFEITKKQIQSVVEYTIFNNLKLIILGESEKYNLGIFKNYSKKSKKFSFLSVGSEIDYSEEKENFQSEKYLNFFALNNDLVDNLFFLGYQNFLVNPLILKYFKQKNYKAFRLSELKEDFLDFEPYFRSSDVVSTDLGVIKHSDCPASTNPQPAGLDATEFCKLAYFAGLSNSLKVFGIYEYNPKNDINNISAKLVAESIWYFLDAFTFLNNYAIQDKNDYSVYHLHIEDNKKEIKLKFIYYDEIDLWWLAINKKKYEKLIPCSYKDFNSAKNGQLTQRINTMIERYSTEINL